ncbi:MAG: DUF4404 family protein [Nevskia sp.]|nr:DUF4404 family protein [Nevskia sp.]
MKGNAVQDSLGRLRTELKQASFGEPAERERVESLLLEIEGHLESTHGAKQQSALLARISDAVRRFEVEHPTITACLNEIAAGLG